MRIATRANDDELRHQYALVAGAIIATGLIALWVIYKIADGEYHPNNSLYVAIALLGWTFLTLIAFAIYTKAALRSC